MIMANGVEIPAVGFGTADFAEGCDAAEIIMEAVRAGYRLIDTAAVYETESAVGEAIGRMVSAGDIRREELFISSKISPGRHSYQDTISEVEQSLRRLGTDYLDLYLIHWPVPRGLENTYRENNAGIWTAFEDLYQAGKLRAIGVSNFLERHLNQIFQDGCIRPMVNQLEIHPRFQQRELVRFCQSQGIIVEAWSPFQGGKGLGDPGLTALAAHYRKSPAQLCVRWCVEQGVIPLPKSSNPGRMRQNLDISGFEITAEDMAALERLDTKDGHLDIWSYKRQQAY